MNLLTMILKNIWRNFERGNRLSEIRRKRAERDRFKVAPGMKKIVTIAEGAEYPSDAKIIRRFSMYIGSLDYVSLMDIEIEGHM